MLADSRHAAAMPFFADTVAVALAPPLVAAARRQPAAADDATSLLSACRGAADAAAAAAAAASLSADVCFRDAMILQFQVACRRRRQPDVAA